MVRVEAKIDQEYGLPQESLSLLIAEGVSSIRRVDPNKIPEAVRLLDALSSNPKRAAAYSAAATDYAIEYFGIKDGELAIHAELMPAKVFASEVEKAFSFKDCPTECTAPAAEVHKRRLINALIQGGAHGLQNAYLMLPNTLLSQEERDAFSTMISHGDRMYFEIPSHVQARLANDPKAVAGLSSVVFDNPMAVHVSACLGPVLFHEIGKGVLEVLALDGLPSDPKVRGAVQGAADRREHEHKDFQIGLALWKRFLAKARASGASSPRQQLSLFRHFVELEPARFQDFIVSLLQSSK